ncbi:unnamed protein product, partial [Urochloa humidicola]
AGRGRLFPTAAGLLARGQLPARGRRISGRARVEDLELDARAPSRVEDLEPGHLGPAELVRRWSRSWHRRLPCVLSTDRREPLLPVLDPGGKVLFGGRDLCTPAAGEVDPEATLLELLCTAAAAAGVIEREGRSAARSSSRAGIVAWSGGLVKPSSLRDEASSDAAFLCRWASRPAAGGAAAGVATISPSLSVKSSSTRHLSVPELEGLVDLVESGSGREKAPGGSSNNLDRTTNWTSKASDSPWTLEEPLTEYERDDSENDQEEMCNE